MNPNKYISIPHLTFFILFSLFSAQTLLAQKSIILKGRVTAKGSGEPMPYTNVALQKSNMGTITNLQGEFKLIIPSNTANDSLRISFIGYNTALFSLNNIGAFLDCQLTEDPLLLQEVFITDLSAQNILATALQKIPENYYGSAFLSKGFYRVSSTKNQEYIHLSEAVFDLFQSKVPHKKQQFKLDKMRAIKDEKASHGINMGLRVNSIFEFDVINQLGDFDLLNKKGLKNHDFVLEGTANYDDTKAFVLSFDQKDGKKIAGYKGKLFIDANTFAFLYIDYGISPKGLAYFSYGDKGTRVLMSLLDIHLKMDKDEYQLSYKKTGGKYYLNHVGNDARISFKSSRNHYEFELETRVDYLVTSIQTEAYTPFSSDELLGKGKFIENQNSMYDPDFWKNYNIILPDHDFASIAKDIEAKNKANDHKLKVEELKNKFPKEKEARLDSILSYYNSQDIFNGNVLVTYNNEILLQKSYNNELTQNKENSQFRIGSVAKTFTGMLIMMLQNEGKLSVKDSVGKFIPHYPHPQITLAQLLTHQSGIPNYLDNNNYLVKLFEKPYPLQEIVTQFCSDSLEFEPEAKFAYSNSGYVLLGLVIEKVTRKPLGEVLKEKIFSALGMKDTYFGQQEDTSNLAAAFMYGKPEPMYFPQNVGGAGGITSTSADLLKWSKALDENTLLSSDRKAEMWARRVKYEDWDADYGYGWMIDRFLFEESKKHEILYHPGTDFGFNSLFLKQPDEGITIILLNNTGDFPRFDIADLILTDLN
ncbi:serine hydrolase [Flammeovirgaceae bacterium SG7u.111]|nr:serine hydrolase [Flammeovirgaceae bacterium SG7u.132]WPO37488.1 serine hydrolase [Flammeovirgaceae bacterium SG7u.111]